MPKRWSEATSPTHSADHKSPIETAKNYSVQNPKVMTKRQHR